MWTMWNDVRPQCNHCQLTLSFAALPDRQANGQWQPYRSTQISSSPAYQALLGLLQTWIEKIETNQMRNREEDLIFGKPFTFAGGGDGA